MILEVCLSVKFTNICSKYLVFRFQNGLCYILITNREESRSFGMKISNEQYGPNTYSLKLSVREKAFVCSYSAQWTDPKGNKNKVQRYSKFMIFYLKSQLLDPCHSILQK